MRSEECFIGSIKWLQETQKMSGGEILEASRLEIGQVPIGDRENWV